jgi:hypothetical protein
VIYIIHIIHNTNKDTTTTMFKLYEKEKHNNPINVNKDVHTMNICIPKVDKSIATDKVEQVFKDLKLGEISRIVRYNQKVFIFFKSWNTNEKTNKVYERLEKGEDSKVMYDFPLYWKFYKKNPLKNI